jgi:hypothetical protein
MQQPNDSAVNEYHIAYAAEGWREANEIVSGVNISCECIDYVGLTIVCVNMFAEDGQEGLKKTELFSRFVYVATGRGKDRVGWIVRTNKMQHVYVDAKGALHAPISDKLVLLDSLYFETIVSEATVTTVQSN